MLLSSLLFCSNLWSVNTLSYDNVDLKNKEKTQQKINDSYNFGISIMKRTIIDMKKERNMNLSDLMNECNDSLYSAIFSNSIIDKFDKEKAKIQFIKDCEKFIKSFK